LIAILLTGGEAHDYPVAERLIRRVNPPEHLLGDMAYDGDGLREELDQNGTKPVIPEPPEQKAPIQLQQTPLQAALAARKRIQQAEGLQTHRNAIRYLSRGRPRSPLLARSIWDVNRGWICSITMSRNALVL
jgi:hypothetical protein